MIGFGFSVFTQAILGLGGGFRGSSLNLDFTSGSRTLDPRVTFSRTSNATLTNSAGLVAYAPHNLLTYSEQFDNAAWTKTAATVSANSTTAPNGTVTADCFFETTANSAHYLTSPTFTASANTTFTLSCYVKSNGSDAIEAQISSGSYAVRYSLTTGVLIQSAGITSSSLSEPDAQGFRRLIVTATVAATSVPVIFAAAKAQTGLGGLVFVGDAAKGIYIWGAQLELGSTATTYNPTAVKNLLGYTEHFDNAAWTKSNASITSGFTDIYGQPFAQQVTSSASNGTVLSTYTAVASTPYTFSIWMKRVTGTGNIDISADGTTWATRTLTTEWQRFSVTASPTAGSKTPGVRIATSGDSIYIFGAQLSDSASVDPYVYNPVAAPSSVAYYGPRFDYDPVTLAPKGLLIEEQRTNLVLQSQTFKITPWSSYLSTTVANAAVAPDGTTTATSMIVTGQYGNISQTVTVSASTTYTYSCYVRVPTGSTALIMQSFDGTSYTNVSLNVGSTWTRVTRTVTTGAAATTLTLQIIDNSASAWVGVQIWGAQLEAGAFATSYIPTAASQVTRAADSASMIGNNFARWYNVNEGTFYSEYKAGTELAHVATSGVGRFMYATAVSGGTSQVRIYDGTQSAVSGSYQIANFVKASTAFSTSGMASCVSGGTVGTSPYDGTISDGNLYLGRLMPSNSEYLNGTIRRLAYYNRRLSNAELQSITA